MLMNHSLPEPMIGQKRVRFLWHPRKLISKPSSSPPPPLFSIPPPRERRLGNAAESVNYDLISSSGHMQQTIIKFE
ncbi:hypothetical protein CEXT_253451 [Caerostris extrusa]|uniref:Uncharacterized protein n=1 Tax=Caerostris extrusa TaxID=172846 RepID=A0AAV4N4N4_CAEEX|nr:hypothetical protein CEXT_253451 [Caerostris extrusa]